MMEAYALTTGLHSSIQLLGTYYKDTSDKQNGPLEQLSVQTALIGDDDVIYYPMTKDEHTALLQYNSDEAVAEREEFVGKFGVVMDILESIENPQPILDGFMSKYKDSKKRGLEDIERILSPKKHKKMEESTKVNASKEEVEQSTPKTTAKKPVENTVSKQNPPKKKQTITKPDMESKKKHATTKPDIDSKKKQNTVTKPDIEHKKKRDTTTKPDINNKKKQQNMNKKKNAKKSPNGIQKTPSHSKSTPKPTHKKSPSKIEIPQ
jgi:hypothetical protein